MAVTVFNSYGGYSTGLTGYVVISQTGTVTAVGGVSAAGSTFESIVVIGNIIAPNILTSFNGLTGAVQGVSAAVAGTGISVSGTTGSVTITNTGVQSIGGATGAVTYLDCGSL